MADVKISGLPASTTPLAGTEVLPIVQSGVTKQVANNDLRPKQIQSNATSGVLQIAGPAAAAIRVMTTPDANFTVARTDTAQSFTGNQTLSTGNLVIGTAGKGIDFSINPAAPGVTSELLDDYEIGTWTPALTFGGAAVGMAGTFTGTYTKIGDTVTVWGAIILTAKGSSTGSATITGLPYATSTSYSSNVFDTVAGMAGLLVGGCIFSVPNSTNLFPMVQSISGRTQITDTNFQNTGNIRFSSTYKV